MAQKLDYRQDLAEDAALQRRRYRELQRQSRVFDARVRTIGVDTEALDAQIRDRKIQEATQRAYDDTIAAEMKQNDKILCILDERQKRDSQILNKAVNEFRQTYQQPETRREFDLSDPQALKKDTPARLADSDPRCTISGLQKFMGEDLNSEKRWKFQKEQTREWLLQQQKDWENALADKKYADDLHDQHRMELDQKAVNLQRINDETRRAICITTTEFNKALAADIASRRRLEKQQEDEDNIAEISNLLRGDLLSENPQQAASSFGNGRVIPNRWKGMNQDQLKEIRDVQLQQVLEKLRLEEEERQRNAEWDRKRIQEARAEVLFERHQQRQNRELRRTLDNLNAQLSQEQKTRQAYIDEEVYSNFPSGQYYTQFNTTSR
ncbi:RIB43A-like with coiled-coils protein 2 isoform X1 [Podarcis raffonei]|uniref:RIB43A-like with coiled-coils protein 2 isoform X1 n=2 Tax=Podarcis raffonei TaxID=65483 RepID=UPI002329538C|nr:RIB43A-like with coiled-coils protein 2 isoform X1 [Podarcis raffonei]XP_053243559.1 RIB43A-like with coiled-coils protein 2 isoform X1 [Podarcis raffonei]XP_053243560.1 RIB43A-like with coiled-coils protein 2 isoform X1 [Podarcis raffonei]XP_053243562.1 RIB43A-like with coiled-coils protein 2 isoform X1 [Podarcis raffonei]XP_053243563.1 RIB43A-like with coiled-coils protein 2 isoform X1 [Podarcis raffonei]